MYTRAHIRTAYIPMLYKIDGGERILYTVVVVVVEDDIYMCVFVCFYLYKEKFGYCV